MPRVKNETDSNISTLMSDNPKQMDKYKITRGKSSKRGGNGEVSWIIYYYLLSISHYNYDEEHRYVYKNEFNVSQLSRDLDFSRPYYYAILEKLKKQGLIAFNADNSAILFPILPTSIQIDQTIFQALLGYAPKLGIDILRTYLFLCIVYKKGSYKKFTKRNIVKCLGHTENNNEAYKMVDLYLDLFDKWGLVYLRKNAREDDTFGTFYEYSIEKLNKKSEYLEEQIKERQKEMNNFFGLTENEQKEIEKMLNE